MQEDACMCVSTWRKNDHQIRLDYIIAGCWYLTDGTCLAYVVKVSVWNLLLGC